MRLISLRCAISILLLISIVLSQRVLAGDSHVLILNSYHQGMDWTDGEIAGVKESLDNYGPVQFHIEYMDSKRLTDRVHINNLRQLFSYKYRSLKLNAIVATDNDAFDFIRSHRDELFPGVPVVFCGVNWFRETQLKGLSGFTGVAEAADSASTLALMLRLHPATERIVVIIDSTTTGKVLRTELEPVAEGMKGRVNVEFWDSYSPGELSRKVASLPNKSLVLLMPYASDQSGRFISYPDIARMISDSSSVPVYGSWDFYLGYGIVGGNLTTAKAQGVAAGEILIRVLKGENADNIPVRTQVPNYYTFDYQQLARFNISQASLPEYSTIINQPWHETNKILLWGGGVIALTMSVMLWSLLLSLARKRKADVELRIAAKAFESQVAMVVSDSNGIFLRVNQAFTESTGYSAEEAIGRKASLLKSGRHDKSFYEQFWAALQERHFWQGVIWNRRKNGSIYAEWLTVNAVLNPAGEVTHYVSSFSDITQNKAAEAEVHRLAYYDQLTQLPNRRLLQDRLGQAVALAERSGIHGVVLFLDLDNFNTLNDTRGHETGDQLLIQVAQRVRQLLRPADTLSRLGGDEFVIILEDLNEDQAAAATMARQYANNLCFTIAQPYSLQGMNCIITASIGICLFQGGETVEHLLKNADMAMYQAKANGRNTLRFFDPEMQAALDKRSLLENDLRHALERNELQLYYQLQVDAAGAVIGAEILLRWKHPQRHFISPADFIPLAEETGLILPIGQWVIEGACQQLKAWSVDPLAANLRLSVNVSSVQFRQDDFVENVREVLQRTAIDSTRLKLELTESLILDDLEEVIDKMQALKALGVAFSLDDFGTGYSSLSYLTRLPLDELKIDQSFVSSLPGSRNDEIIVQTIITMGESLGLRVIAEGVETAAQRDFLELHGCHAYQGYFFGRPVPLAEFMSSVLQRT